MVASLDDLMSRYTPAVAPHRYRVRFVPVVQKDSSEEERYLQCMPDSGWVSNGLRRKRLATLQSNQPNWSDISRRPSLEKKMILSKKVT